MRIEPRQPVDLDALPNGIVLVEDGGGILDANAAMLELLRCDAAWLRGKPLSAVLTRPAAILYHASLYVQLRGRGRVQEAYLDFIDSTGEPVPVLCSATLREVGSQVVILISATRMTERRRMEKDLLRTRRITEQIPGVVYQYLLRPDGTGSMPYASEALRQLFGVSPLDVQQDSSALLRSVHPDDVRQFSISVAESAKTLQTWRQQFRVSRSGGPYRWLEGHATPERLTDGSTLWHGFVQDVTDRKAVEDAMQEKQAADRANVAKSEFLARVSHELRTPLNAILGFAQILAMDRKVPLRRVQRHRVQYIEEAGRDLLELIDEVLDITRIESGEVRLQPMWVAAGTVLKKSLRLVEDAARKRDLQLRVLVDDDIVVCADPARLTQVLTNLLSNAVKYTKDGGTVTASCSVTGDTVFFLVHDDGPGMSEDQLEHLYEPFNRLGAERSTVQGSGLGLVIVKRLVEAMGGSISVASSHEHGTTFHVLLPYRETDETPTILTETRADASERNHAPSASRILYVEDNPVNAVVMEAICEMREGLALHVASTGKAAIEWIAKHPVDLLLLDMNLPDAEGVQLLRDLRIACGRPMLRAVAVSADAMPDYVERARLAGFSEYWTKPLNVTETLRKLASNLDEAAASPDRPSDRAPEHDLR